MAIIFFFNVNLIATDVYEIDKKKLTYSVLPFVPLSLYGNLKMYSQDDLSIETVNKLSKNQVNRFERFAVDYYSLPAKKTSDYLVFACVATPFVLLMDENIKGEYFNVGVIVAQSYFVTSALVSFTKVVSERKRPLTYNENIDIKIRQNKDNKNSFFSGHTALSFNGAILTAKIYDDFHPEKNNTWIYATGAVAASTVGYLRLKAGKHYPTDIITGAVVGTASALLITELYKNKPNLSISANSSHSEVLTPILNFCFEF